MKVNLLDASSPHWGREVERAGVELGAGYNPTLFPYHFLYVTLPKIGGYMVVCEKDGPVRSRGSHSRPIGIGFLFPRLLEGSREHARKVYTLRYHSLLPPGMPVEPGAVTDACRAALGGDSAVFYDPQGPHTYARTGEEIGPVEFGRPSAAEAQALRSVQAEVWGSPPEFLYPADIHSHEFAAGSSIVARVEGVLAGFLFGFTRFGGSPLPGDWEERYGGDLRLESQTMAVLPAYRGLRIASLLKRVQAREALVRGIGVIHWTADPLQFPNAALNFGLLRAVAYEFAADLYPFRNDLNRVHASRLSLTWLPGSRRVDDVPLVGAPAEIADLGHRPQIVRVNDGHQHMDLTRSDALIAIEVPRDWTVLQQDDLDSALAWRQATDTVLRHYLGAEEGRYTITGVGTHGERRFLLAEQVTAGLWARLGASI